MPIINRIYFDAAQKGRDAAQQEQSNALLNQARQQDINQGQYVNNLMRDPTTTPEQFARAGRADIGNYLVGAQNSAARASDEQVKAFATQIHSAAQYASQAPPGQTKPFIEKNFPFLVQAYGPDWANATEDQVHNELTGIAAKYGVQAGIAPQQPKQPNLITGLGPDGNPMRIADAPGVRPYVQADKPDGTAKPQLIDVPMPDGTVQKQWVYPGKASGTAVGAPTTPKDAGPGGGGREATMFNRVLMSASQATKTLENIVKLPMSTSTGIFGGSQSGTSLLGSSMGALKNAMTTQEVQSYKPIIAGLTRSLAGIEAAGMMPSGTLTHQMDAVIFQEGDTQLTKLRKLAEARQIVQEGVSTYLENPRVADSQKKQISGFLDRMEKAIPFSQDDVTVLETSNDPKLTIKDVVNQRLKGDAQPAQIKSDAEYAALPSGAQYVAPDGSVRRKK